MIDEKQIPQIKQQLIQQIESTFPEEKRKEAIEKVQGMNPQELEEFLIQNNLIGQPGQAQPQAGEPGKCIFCSIVSGEVPTTKIDENKVAIASLEINPVSKGHTLIIPKEHLENSGKLPSSAFTLAKKISKKIKTKLKPKEVTIVSTNLFGHEIINVLPVYENENLGSPRQQAKPEELEQLKKLLEVKPKPKRQSKPKKIKEKKLWLNKRMP